MRSSFGIAAGAFLSLAACGATPDAASDGRYSGTMQPLTLEGKCLPGRLDIVAAGNRIDGALHRAGQALQGTIAGDGAVHFETASEDSRFRYSFTGVVVDGTMRGSWTASPPVCEGRWSAERLD